ncbi:venom acid phosphatase Acph-1-like [Phymastichus coffea]|uniref:venom acid phosphatase Acph-1-like n=1 Tax=Phymastichus coffea TaxID=108790 RepID=UPI00273C4505|nr:venom acid phosphatase Acph-1-like [Phymastichus coffea]XP_058801324.1 venom acid phosphatase Acph-1-like [Phymastichus coffea]XP_058809247.1 venom acid phosphatase Acph-1-like [Phymastichus coffea]
MPLRRTIIIALKKYRLIALILVIITHSIKNAMAELKLLNVIFRHGDRAPDNNGLELYPRDPYVNNSFWPEGLGGLTNSGKLREYNLGKYLRKSYGYFLGDVYIPAEIRARSTDIARTKMSLQLLLAALYTPERQQKWKLDLDWQPIPIDTVAKLDDILMIPEECPNYLKVREQVETSSEFKVKLRSFESFMRNLSSNTGKNISHSNDMYFLYHTLMAEHSLDLPLPKWTKNIFPYGKLLDGISLEYKISNYNTEMKRMNGGMLLRKFIDDMVTYSNGKLDRNRKIFLYSGHETNVVAVLQALGVYYPHVPEYTSAVIIELHEVNSKYYVKVIYYKGIARPNENLFEEMYVTGCNKNCSLDRFQNVLKNVTAIDNDIKSCDKRSLRGIIQEMSIAPGIIKQIVDELDIEDSLRNMLLY